MAEELSTHVGLATPALLCYRLLFCSVICSARELSLTALLFCAACSWYAGQLAAAAARAELAAVPLPLFLSVPLSIRLRALGLSLTRHNYSFVIVRLNSVAT